MGYAISKVVTPPPKPYEEIMDIPGLTGILLPRWDVRFVLECSPSSSGTILF